MEAGELPVELPVVAALRSLSIFDADQGGAYREHFEQVAQTLGQDVATRLGESTRTWAEGGEPGIRILTGNNAARARQPSPRFSRALPEESLPSSDELTEVAEGRWVLKDLSGLSEQQRPEALAHALGVVASGGQVLVCANEGVLRDAIQELDSREELTRLLETALLGWRCSPRLKRLLSTSTASVQRRALYGASSSITYRGKTCGSPDARTAQRTTAGPAARCGITRLRYGARTCAKRFAAFSSSPQARRCLPFGMSSPSWHGVSSGAVAARMYNVALATGDARRSRRKMATSPAPLRVACGLNPRSDRR